MSDCSNSTATVNLTVAILVASIGLCQISVGQSTEQWRSWNQPVDPFQIADNVYYVGANDIAAYLITGDEGHVVLDGGFPETAAIIRAGIAKLGFRIEDVEVLINSHAHFDHAGGLAELKAVSGARLFVSEPDADLMERGGVGDFLFDDSLPFPAVNVDERFADGDTLRLGTTEMVPHITAGHTQGCTTWTMDVTIDGRTKQVVWVCSVSVLSEARLVKTADGEPSYPGIRADFEHSFDVLRSLDPEFFLGSHARFFALEEKLKMMQAPEFDDDVNLFIDPERYRAYVENAERTFRSRLAEQRELEIE